MNCTPHHTLFAPLLIITHFRFQTATRNFKDSTPFLSLVPPSGTLSLYDMLKLCPPLNHSSRFTFHLSLALTLSTVSSLHQVNVCVAHMHLY